MSNHGLISFIMDAIGLMGLANSSSGQHGSFVFPVLLIGNYSFGDEVWAEAARFNTGVSIAGCAAIARAQNNDKTDFDSPDAFIELTNQDTVNRIYTIGIGPHSKLTYAVEFDFDGTSDQRVRFTYDGTDIVMNAYATQDGNTTFRCTAFFLFIVSY